MIHEGLNLSFPHPQMGIKLNCTDKMLQNLKGLNLLMPKVSSFLSIVMMMSLLTYVLKMD